ADRPRGGPGRAGLARGAQHGPRREPGRLPPAPARLRGPQDVVAAGVTRVPGGRARSATARPLAKSSGRRAGLPIDACGRFRLRTQRLSTEAHRVSPNAKAPPEIPEELLDPDAVKVVRRLRRAGHQAYLVGGCVRDLLLRIRPKDFDVATSAHPSQVKDTF